MKKYWIVGFVVICLCVAIATVFAQTQSYKGTQWEYGWYHAFGPNPKTGKYFYIWHTPNQRLSQLGGKVSELWAKDGFQKTQDEDALLPDWFSYLGGQGWELVLAESDDLSKSYWFKRPKR